MAWAHNRLFHFQDSTHSTSLNVAASSSVLDDDGDNPKNGDGRHEEQAEADPAQQQRR
jgi:hypothetical protein